MVHGRTSAGHDPDASMPGLAVAAKEETAEHDTPSGPAEERVEWSYAPTADIPSRVRFRLRPLLARWGIDEELADDVLLVATELVANAVDHAHTALRFQARRGGPGAEDVLRIGVHDRRADLPPRLTSAGPNALRGRGLHVIDVLSRRWGCDPAPDGKTVWAEIALPG